jgi:OmpA-OmpF porin, OOP family
MANYLVVKSSAVAAFAGCCLLGTVAQGDRLTPQAESQPFYVITDNGGTAPTVSETFFDASGGTEFQFPVDDSFVEFDVPFAVRVFDNTEGTIRIHDNGYITWNTNAGSVAANEGFPTEALADEPVVAPFWDDLLPTAASRLFVDVQQSAGGDGILIVTWSQMAHFDDPTAKLTFQAVFFERQNEVLFFYQTMTNGTGQFADGRSATIGLQHSPTGGFVTAFHNTAGAVASGLALDFDEDADSDGLPDRYEDLDRDDNIDPGETDPNDFDSDNGGVGDGTEVLVEQSDPNDSSDDVNAADMDGDGISDGDEEFLGLDKTRADTDGDGLDDGIELFTLNTSPVRSDTDGDKLSDFDEVNVDGNPDNFTAGVDSNPNVADSDNGGIDDGDELLSGLDSNNPADDVGFIATASAGVFGNMVDSAVDADGNLHFITTTVRNDVDLEYSMFTPGGGRRIGRTLFGPIAAQNVALKNASIHALPSGRIAIVAAGQRRSGGTGIQVRVIDPALDDQNGDAANAAAITVATGFVPGLANTTAEIPAHIYAAVDSKGIITVVSEGPSRPGRDRIRQMRHYRINGETGARVGKIRVLADLTRNQPFPRPHSRTGAGQNIFVDADDRVHILINAYLRRASRSDFTGSLLYARFSADGDLEVPLTTIVGDYRGHGHGAIAADGTTLYLFYPGNVSRGGNGSADLVLSRFDYQLNLRGTKVVDGPSVNGGVRRYLFYPNATVSAGGEVAVTYLGRFADQRVNMLMVDSTGAITFGPMELDANYGGGSIRNRERPTAADSGPDGTPVFSWIDGGVARFLRFDPSRRPTIADALAVAPVTVAAGGTAAVFDASSNLHLASAGFAASAVDADGFILLGGASAPANGPGSLVGAPMAIDLHGTAVAPAATYTVRMMVPATFPGDPSQLKIYRLAGPNFIQLTTTLDTTTPVPTLTAASGALGTFAIYLPAANVPNLGFTSSPPLTAIATRLYSYTPSVTASFPATVTLARGPAGMAMTDRGVVEWTPTGSQLGANAVELLATDGVSSATQKFAISVGDSVFNQPPAFTSPPPLVAEVGQPYAYTPAIADADGPEARFLLLTGPVGMTLDPGTGMVTWTPTAEQRGQHAVALQCSDGLATATQSFVVLVGEDTGNRPPEFVSAPPTLVIANDSYQYTPVVVDADGDPVSFELVTFPDGMVIDSTTGAVTWTPGAGQAGSNSVSIVADDGKQQSVQVFAVVVQAESGGGCATVSPPAGAGLGLVLLVGVLLLGRRLRRAAGAAAAGVLLVVAVGAARADRVLPQTGDHRYVVADNGGSAPNVTDSFIDASTGTSQVFAGDDVNIAITAPFALQIFGDPAGTSLRVSDNGYLLINPTGAPPSEPLNSFSQLSGFTVVAPFWDDLFAKASSRLQTLTQGSAPNRVFVVRWFDMAHFDDQTAAYDFEVMFFESHPGEVVFLYNTMTNGGQQFADGRSASVGIRSRTAGIVALGQLAAGTVADGLAVDIDLDIDRDQLGRGQEDRNRNGVLDPGETDPAVFDTDAGGVGDGAELIILGTDPRSAGDDAAAIDTDADGLVDADEALLGTDPNSADSDRDGLTDFIEVVAIGTDPNDHDSDDDLAPDGTEVALDGDPSTFTPGIDSDPRNPDTDSGGEIDGLELLGGRNPNDDTDDQNSSVGSIANLHDSCCEVAMAVAVDDDGDLHGVSDTSRSSSYEYAMTSRSGDPLISSTSFAGLADSFGNTGDTLWTKVFALPSGRIAQVWAEGNGGGGGIGYRLIDPALDDQDGDSADNSNFGRGGVTLAERIAVANSLPTLDGEIPGFAHLDASIDGAARIHLVFQTRRRFGQQDTRRILYAKIDGENGKLLSGPTVLFDRVKPDANDSAPTVEPLHGRAFERIFADASGAAHILFAGFNRQPENGGRSNLRYARVSASGAIEIPFTTLAVNVDGHKGLHGVAADASRVYVVHTANVDIDRNGRSRGRADLVFRAYDRATMRQLAIRSFDGANVSGEQLNLQVPALQLDAAGNIVAAYMDRLNAGDIRMAILDRDGNLVMRPITIDQVGRFNDDARRAFHVGITRSPDGSHLAVGWFNRALQQVRAVVLNDPADIISGVLGMANVTVAAGGVISASGGVEAAFGAADTTADTFAAIRRSTPSSPPPGVIVGEVFSVDFYTGGAQLANAAEFAVALPLPSDVTGDPADLAVYSEGRGNWQKLPTTVDTTGPGIVLRATASALGSFALMPAAPVTVAFTSAPLTFAVVGAAYAYAPVVNSAGPVTFAATLAPDGMVVDQATGIVQWVPTSIQAGTHEVHLRASTGTAEANQTFFIQTDAVNTAPMFLSQPTTAADVGVTYSYAPEVQDAEGQTLAFQLFSAPAAMTIDAATGEVVWTPAAADRGSAGVSIGVSDGFTTATQIFEVAVGEGTGNRPPLFVSSPPLAAVVGVAYEYTAVARDPDGQTLSFAVAQGPQGFAIDGATGVVTWTPTASQRGVQQIRLHVSDGLATALAAFAVVVGDANGDGVDDASQIRGGGCAAVATRGNGSWLAFFALIGLWAGSRRRLRIARPFRSAVFALVGVMGAAAPVQAQIVAGARNFALERFRLSLDKNGLFDVEWAEVLPDGGWEVGLALGTSDDPLVVVDGQGERLGSLVSQRFAADVTGAVGIRGWLQVALQLPIIVGQDNDAIPEVMGESIGGGGLGDVRIAPKILLPKRLVPGFFFAVVPSVTLPSATSDAYLGERNATFAPEVIASRPWGHVRASANLGYRARRNVHLAGLEVGDELFVRGGAGVDLARYNLPAIELVGTAALATAAASPLRDESTTQLELFAGGAYQVLDRVKGFAGAGLGFVNGYGTPDWRAVVGVRYAVTSQDSDGDGIEDAKDACPLAAEDIDGFEDTDGCPDPDNDGDGVLDKYDAAPIVPEDRDGFEDEDGVPDPDNDRDGIADDSDRCPLDAETQNGFEDDDGCPDDPDTDGDGLSDSKDQCRDQAEDLDAFEDDDGCPDLDNDGDKVVDASDACINEPGPVENRGCPDKDSDGDGVVDRLDNCPDELGTAANHGCASRQLVVIENTRLRILDKVHFATNKARIRSQSFPLLDNVAQVINSHPHIAKIRVEGHTDSRGPDERNLTLSQARADSVVEYLVSKGVERSRLVGVGYGETKPIADNNSKEGQGSNRRVEFNIISSEDAAAAAGDR